MKKFIGIGLFAFFHLSFAAESAETLQAKLNNMHTMSASFSQIVKAKNRTLSQSSGNMALERPGRFRWQTNSPMQQLFVADGKQLWVYDKELEQVTVNKQSKHLEGTAALFLSGYDNSVTKNFNVTATSLGAEQVYDLHAKSHKASFQRIKMAFTGDRLTEIELYDQLGQHTLVKLSQIKTNPTLSQNLFHFTPPKGVDVVRQ